MTTPVPETAPAAEPAARRPMPRWITNPDLIASIEAGLIDIDDELLGDIK
ncbi:hypothetical protein [Streptomyces prasinus]